MLEAKRYLSAAAEHLRRELVESEPSTGKLAITWSVICDGDIAACILHVAESRKATEEVGVTGISNVIAMATRSYSRIQRWAMGSVSERVLHANRLPLLIVRPGEMVDHSHQARELASMVALPW